MSGGPLRQRAPVTHVLAPSEEVGMQHRPVVAEHPVRGAGARRRGPLDVLRGYDAVVAGRSAAARVAARHLVDLGAEVVDAGAADDLAARIVVRPPLAGRAERPLVVTVGWGGAIGAGLVDEGTVQAACGLMHVCGRRGGVARPVGVDYASIAAGVLAVQAVLAALIARRRGMRVAAARTSVADAALLAVSQYLANATAPQDEEPPAPPDRGQPPPFRSLENLAFELEALDGAVWARFWAQLGVTGAIVGRAWRSFVFRYATADCVLPAELHQTTRSFALEAILAAAGDSGASICVLRTHADRARELGIDAGATVEPVWALAELGSAGDGPADADGDANADADPDGDPAAVLPLTGVRVIEAGRRIQAPLAGHLLRLLGARVTRVEPPGGDPLRWMAPLAGRTSARFRALNDGKEVVEVDLKDARQRDELLDLATRADVFLHNWAPGKAAQLGLDAGDVADRNPAIVYAYASAWGDALGEHPPLGTDFMVQAHAGLADTLTPADEEPTPTLLTALDVMGGLIAVEGILAGLLRRDQSLHGQRVDTSLLSAATVLQADVLEAAAAGREDRRHGGRPRSRWFDRPLRASDGLVWATLGDHDDALRLARALGLAADGDAGVERAILARARARTVRELRIALRGAGVASAAVCEDLAQLADDAPFLSALSFDGCAFVRAPWRWSR